MMLSYNSENLTQKSKLLNHINKGRYGNSLSTSNGVKGDHLFEKSCSLLSKRKQNNLKKVLDEN